MPSHLHDIVKLVVKLSASYKRGARGAEEALTNARNADKDSLDRIIVDQSESAWRAFYSAKKKTGGKETFRRQAKSRKYLDHLIAESPDNQKRFAELLDSELNNLRADMPTHPTTHSPPTIESASDTDNITQPAKRRRLQTIETDSDTDSIAEPTEPPLMGTIASASNADIDNATISAIQQSTATHSTPIHPYVGQLHDSHHIPGQDVSPRGVYVGAPLKVAEELFEDEFWDSIQRIPSKDRSDELMAEISILFQQDDVRANFGCQIEIGIVKEKVAMYAFNLFNAAVRENDGVRSLTLKGGSRVEPDPSTKLRGCRRDLSDTFKGHLYEGFCLSPIYKREEKECRKLTDAVSMSISSRASEGATIVVFVTEWSALKIKQAFNK
ncbi:hypothetical protein FLAG1_10654 [Fusarium langsethiae]|uniref:Uncharacterized protein n=1 Tax=Fusarium langsethiae TaxID=179993 RepID=A0A0M9ENU9_FUSLA|nr:hypothetical protein FLAG1_10654 [Fusarium langsethiae]